MLLEFSVANYLSFKERQTLSLVASNDASHPQNTCAVPGPSDMRLLKSVGIYGANASGKSNLVKALTFMQDFVVTSATKRQRGDAIPVVPFKLDPKTAKQPSEFELVFVLGKEHYVYGFTADKEKVHEEWLTVTARRAKREGTRTLFERSPDGSIDFGGSWKGDRVELARRTRANALFLSVAVQFNNPTAKPVFDWIQDGLRGISDQPEEQSEMLFTMGLAKRHEEFAKSLREFLAVADLGIESVEIDAIPLFEMDEWQNLPLELREKAREEILSKLPDGQEAEGLVARSLHKTQDGQPIAFDLEEEESAGTLRLFSLAGPWFHVVTKGCVLLIDELDTKLHPHMTRFLVNQIHQAPTTPQLIFTTHDSGLLDSKLFRRDQIWFTEKDKDGATQLYSLWDYKDTARAETNMRNGYLKGRYGAIPFIGEFSFAQEHE